MSTKSSKSPEATASKRLAVRKIWALLFLPREPAEKERRHRKVNMYHITEEIT
jgi:hypothetical protein